MSRSAPNMPKRPYKLKLVMQYGTDRLFKRTASFASKGRAEEHLKHYAHVIHSVERAYPSPEESGPDIAVAIGLAPELVTQVFTAVLSAVEEGIQLKIAELEESGIENGQEPVRNARISGLLDALEVARSVKSQF